MAGDSFNLKRIALCLQYEGSSFCGWQRQPKGKSIQGVLEEAISILDPLRPVRTIAAGRTDSGVHAAGQVVHFDASGPIPAGSWSSALNGRLPKQIRVRQAVLRPSEWHACYSAIYRRYRYTIYNACMPNLFLAPWSWHRYKFRLDEKLMRIALEGLLGFHDFYAFQRSGSKRKHSWTTIQEVELDRHGDLLVLEIQASGFLYGMVRLLVGQLVALGEHRISLKTFEKRWKECLRSEVKESAPAKGLCLVRAGYAEPVFSESAWHDSFPRYSLATIDSPIAPPPI
ncbi:tRNA pseudouridine(38-40) synthase TruA [Prochlorococcus sp. MIT 1307]|uniref:tRNA pseudouridine(38-40) synthase TruA n=1 Tax=Prochlorococcus sp. MIT 1307 TaxID=3096219 RepID=UPI002A74A5AE|nr:tRNA pseudouridine(38-40) synthase TruA [Prochlorococcus sp. MIT 1307]